MATLVIIKEAGSYKVVKFEERGFTSKAGEDVTFQDMVDDPDYAAEYTGASKNTPAKLTVTNKLTGVVTLREYYPTPIEKSDEYGAYLERGKLLWQRQGKKGAYLKTYEADIQQRALDTLD